MEDLKTRKDYIKRYARIITWTEEDKVYVVRFPELPGCVTHGQTMKEAFQMGDEAAEAYLSVLDDLGKPYPIPEAMHSKDEKKFQLRLDVPLFQFIKMCAEEAGVSINEKIIEILQQGGSFYAQSSPEIREKIKLMRAGMKANESPEEKLTRAIFGKAPEKKKSSKQRAQAPKDRHSSTRKRAN